MLFRSSVPGTYTVEFAATDWTGNTSEPIIITVKVLNYPPSITYYSKGTKNPIVDGAEYAETLTVEFKGKGILTDLATGIPTEIASGSKIYDGHYSLTATLEDGASKTVTFTVDTKPETAKATYVENGETKTVELGNSWYKNNITISFNVDKVDEAILLDLMNGGAVISNDKNAINGMTLNPEGTQIGRYTLLLRDSKGTFTAEFYVLTPQQ